MVEQILLGKRERRCLICKKPLPDGAHGNLLYCSDACRVKGSNIRRRLRRKEEYKRRPKLICLRCGKPFATYTQGAQFYCPPCRKEREKERMHRLYMARRERAGLCKPKRKCLNCGAHIIAESEAYCWRCRRRYKILR